MTSPFWKAGVALATVATLAACSGTPQTPTTPSAASAGSTAAAADGSTLKVSAPVPLAPTGGARIDTRRPTLSWSGAEGTYASVVPTYEVEVSADGAVVYSAITEGTSHQVGVDAAFDTAYTWRVRARQEAAFGPWSGPATFQSPQVPTTGVTTGFRTPDPAPGTRLPLPVEIGIINEQFSRNYDDWQHSCQEHYGERGWIWLDKLIDRLRTKDLRWGYNGKRGNPNDPSMDIIDYHYGAGASQGSTQVYIIDVLLQHCGNAPTPAWIDQTAATAAGNTVGRFIYPRPGRSVPQ